MLDPLINLVDNRGVVIAALFVAAWLISRGSGALARRLLVWHDRRPLANDPGEAGKLGARRWSL
jgi:energy-converting hydrogenase Eha subunit B